MAVVWTYLVMDTYFAWILSLLYFGIKASDRTVSTWYSGCRKSAICLQIMRSWGSWVAFLVLGLFLFAVMGEWR